MKISQLSQRSGVPVPTIKFYLREELLDAGTPTSVNQHRYDETHLQRVRLVQALTHIGGLSLAQVRAVLYFIEKPDPTPLHEVLGQTLNSARSGWTNDQYNTAAGMVQDLITRYRWNVGDFSPARLAASGIAATLVALGCPDLTGMLDRFAYHADSLAYADDEPASTRQALIKSVIGDRLLLAVLRLAEENVYATTGKVNHDGQA